MSSSLLNNIADFYVDAFDKCLSDVHVPLCITIKLNDRKHNKPKYNAKQKIYRNTFNTVKTVWKADLAEEYKNETENIMDTNIERETCELNKTKETITNDAKLINKILIDSAKHIGICSTVKTNSFKINHRKHKKQKWYNDECNHLRKQYMNAKKEVYKKRITRQHILTK